MSPQSSSEFVALQTALAGRYSLERELGRGGMGIVFLAHEVALDRPLALKLLPPELAARDDVRARFLQEARTAAKLSHPHIVPIYAVDEVEDFVFYAMALVDGETLGERVRTRGPLSDADATRMVREVAWALSYAHLQGVVHRDVKPDNILLERGTGRALVTDFGIAQVEAGDAGEGADQVLGTAEFMSPEQARGGTVDARSDLYSLGAVGFYAVSGRLPFEDPSPSVVLAKHVTEPAPPVASRAPQVTLPLGRAIDRCLRKEPDQRFADGGALADALSQDALVDRQVPVALRVFIKHLREQPQSLFALTVFFLLFIAPALVGFMMIEGGLLGPLLVVATPVALVGGAVAGYLAFQARKVLGAGHTLQDARLALHQDVIRRNEEFRFEVGERTTIVDRIASWVAAGGLLMGGGAFAASILAQSAAMGLLPFGAFGLTAGVGALVFRAARARRRADVVGERLLKVLDGRLGRWLFKVAGIGMRAPEAKGIGTYRPTEMAIGLAASRLFEELPKETRRTLAGLPETLKGLEEDARVLRAHVKELSGVLMEIGDDPATPGHDARARVRAEVEATRDAAESRLRAAVTALETIRLGLLRMHAGESVVQSVTMELEAAKDLSADMADLLEGHREVERLLAERRATGTFTIVDE
jgi:serine/threonine-protein kinase